MKDAPQLSGAAIDFEGACHSKQETQDRQAVQRKASTRHAQPACCNLMARMFGTCLAVTGLKGLGTLQEDWKPMSLQHKAVHEHSVVILQRRFNELQCKQCVAGLYAYLLNLAHEVSNSLTGRVDHKLGASNVIISHAGSTTHV